MLFDIEEDPAEKCNLSSKLPGVVAEFHHNIDEVLSEMERTNLENLEAPVLDEEMVNRLRELGYVQ